MKFHHHNTHDTSLPPHELATGQSTPNNSWQAKLTHNTPQKHINKNECIQQMQLKWNNQHGHHWCDSQNRNGISLIGHLKR
jgi:hypothetical protein